MTETVEEFLARGGKIKQATTEDNAAAKVKFRTDRKGVVRYEDIGQAALGYNSRGGKR